MSQKERADRAGINRHFTPYVTRIDRLARSMKDLQNIVHELKAQGVAWWKTEQPLATGTAAGPAFLDKLRAFAKCETNLRRERQLERTAAARARGMYWRRKLLIDPAIVPRLREPEWSGCDRQTSRPRVFCLLGKVGT